MLARLRGCRVVSTIVPVDASNDPFAGPLRPQLLPNGSWPYNVSGQALRLVVAAPS